MPTVRKSVIVPHSRETMFALVDGCERYPEFLPWCSGAQVLERSMAITRARLEISYHGLKSSFTTLNRKEPPACIDLELVEGPFDTLGGRWRFTPLGEAGCRVELALDYGFSNAALEAVLDPVFGHLMETFVDRFVDRAAADAAGHGR